MRAINLIKLAAESEILRIQHMLKRQGIRAAFGAVAAVFAISVLILIEIIIWQVLKLYLQPLYATLCLLGINLVLAIVFALLAAKSSPGHVEREALVLRQQAVERIQSSLALGALVPVASNLLRSRRSKPRRWPFAQKRIR
jgi:hypothetical protein